MPGMARSPESYSRRDFIRALQRTALQKSARPAFAQLKGKQTASQGQRRMNAL
jgi:hypothetical protein